MFLALPKDLGSMFPTICFFCFMSVLVVLACSYGSLFFSFYDPCFPHCLAIFPIWNAIVFLLVRKNEDADLFIDLCVPSVFAYFSHVDSYGFWIVFPR